jgi:hypothetical protein
LPEAARFIFRTMAISGLLNSSLEIRAGLPVRRLQSTGGLVLTAPRFAQEHGGSLRFAPVGRVYPNSALAFRAPRSEVAENVARAGHLFPARSLPQATVL